MKNPQYPNGGLLLKNMTGRRCGQLTVLGRAGSSPSGLATWRVRCDCGNELVKTGSELRRGAATRCPACFARTVVEQKTRHGETGTYLHTLWMNIQRRCYEPTYTGYKNYGGRGIRVCRAWRESYEEFASDIRSLIGDRPTAKHTLDRFDNDGNYEPGNVRWATKKEQAANRRPRSRWEWRKTSRRRQECVN